ncbi:MAG: rubrerythrin family protein [Candidatus Aenigmatarchaeota archaeon]
MFRRQRKFWGDFISETDKNLDNAFGGESRARSKYLLYAERAEEEGLEQIAKLFRAVAKAEAIHIGNHAEAMDKVKETVNNLQDAIEGEKYENSEMYPKFLEKAREEGEKNAARSFRWAKEVEEVHEELYKKAKKKAEEGKDMEEKKIFICGGCGYTTMDEAPDVCPVCGAPKKMFEEVE